MIISSSRQLLTIQRAARLLDSGLVSSSQLSLFCHSMAVAGDEIWGLNAYNNIIPWNAISKRALESDERRKYDQTLSIFDGIPISIKSNIAEKTLPLTAGSFILGYGKNNTPPCGYDADVVRILLREKGGVCIGTTSMDEFGMGSLGINSRHPDNNGSHTRHVKNPLPFLRHLCLDDKDNDDNVPIGYERTRLDDERLATIVQLPPEIISEKHHEALKSIQKEKEDDKDNYGISCGNHFYYSAGGSSCGSAASVAHGSSLLSIGTDTGGSVRLPAAWCGIVGLKPSYGLLSRHGVVSYASSFDTVGVLVKSVDCAASALDLLAQRDVKYSRDSTFSSYDGIDNSDDISYSEIAIAQTILSEEGKEESRKPLSGVRVGIPSSFSVEECPNEIKESWSRAANWLNDNGAEIIEISTKDITPELVQRALSAYYILVCAEASSNLSRYDGFRYGVTADADDEEGKNNAAPDNVASDLTPLERQYSATRRQGFGTETIRRILCGTSVLSSDKFHTYYEAAAQIRAHLAEEIYSVLDKKVDVILIPSVLSLPHKISAQNEDYIEDNTGMFANDIMTVPASLAGLPAVSIPIPIDGEETFLGGMQLISSRFGEATLIKSAKVLEQIQIIN
mmetsp:Transcript_11960/g.13060  ORF Transcript_11960/g.13060 Transcript_11960/m.13060 type:complete len:623 (+) Transcript_11960:47-1915(+)